ncbi:GDP-mannose 4,6-dehydratase [Yersinia pseudotuberculosis]|uniref:GDP-mannose 4,6-dehydratase n=1 Tax=Yersinia pseudotuberculosis TaxID=633 RepID=UPI00061BCF1B|nr:GDP-mannose 4,6-dehydratase [Yersinia pseudotuberculosis]CNK43738.1 CDP-paratose 2-epimerase [Yersinia pseudotuberculosis]
MPGGFDESIPLTFHSPYGCSKGAAEQYMLDYVRIYGLKTVVFRHSSMYSGRQFSTYDQG